MAKRTQRKKHARPEGDERKEVRAVWAGPDLLAKVDMCAAARRWTRAAYVLFAIEEQVKRDFTAPPVEQQAPVAAVG